MKSISAVSDHWKNVRHEPGVHPHEEAFINVFIRACIHKDKILEIGVGDGRMQKILIKNDVSTDALYGVDLTDNIHLSPGKKFICDARSLVFESEEFDVVYSLGVVEHFDETYTSIKEHARVAKKGGVILITVPHIDLETLYRVYTFYKKKQFKKGSFMNIKGRNMRLRSVVKMMDSAGIDIHHYGTSGTVSSLVKRKWPNFYEKYMKKYEHKLGAYLYVIGCKR